MAQPVELILARNLISGISLPALLCDREGTIVFFNDAAGTLLGQRFDETGTLSADEFTSTFGLAEGEPAGSDDSEPLGHAVRAAVPVHRRLAQPDGGELALSTLPLRTVEGCQGSILLLWQTAAQRTGQAEV